MLNAERISTVCPKTGWKDVRIYRVKGKGNQFFSIHKKTFPVVNRGAPLV